MAARQVRGMEQKDLAERAELALGVIRKIERGEREVNDLELERFMLVLGFPKNFFTRPKPSSDSFGESWICGEGVVMCSFPGCVYCSDYLCDYPTGKGKTCDLALCEDHGIAQGSEWEDLHFCPQHSLIDRGLVRS